MGFLSWAVETFSCYFSCYWLTSRSRDGSIEEIERAFRFARGSTEVRGLVRAIRPAPWGVEKVSGIDLSRDFYWVDDDPDSGSVAALGTVGKSSRLIIASTDQLVDDLARVRKLLEKVTFNPRDLVEQKVFMKEINDGDDALSPEMAQWWWDR
jgi:hypothetical protein